MAEGRSTFSFAPAAAAQSQPSGGGGINPIQMQGGNTSIAGGVAAASQFTQAGPSAPALGGFLTEILQPAIDRKKKELYVKGMVDQMSATAGDEIRVNNKNPLNTIFGPSSYEEGAIFYSAQKATTDWQSKMMADKDNLKRLPPDELTKVIASSFDSMQTGDKFTDTAVNAALIEASQPVIGAIAKERYSWQQQEALSSWSSAVNSSGSGLQSMATSLTANSDPTDPGNIAFHAAHNNFLSGLQKPAGMDDATYKKGLTGFYAAQAEAGNGYAVSALKASGFLDLLDDDARTKLEDKELKYGNRALGRAAMAFAPDIDKLSFQMEFGKISATDAMSELATINQKVRGATGFDQDLYDYKDIVGAGKNVWTAMHASLTRQEDRKWQLEDRAASQQFQLDRDEKKAHDEAAQIQTAWGAGRVKTAQAAGIGSTGNFDILAQADYAAGDWSHMARAYNNEGWTSGLVKDQVQAQIKSSVGGEYNKDFEQGYQKFSALNKQAPAVASAYYDDLYAPMLNYQRLVTGGEQPRVAFGRAFSNPAQYAPQPEMTKKALSAIDTVVAGRSKRAIGWNFLGMGQEALNPSGQNALKNSIGRQLAVQMKNSDLPQETLVAGLYQKVLASGAYEEYGRLGWTNAPGTENLGKSLGLQQDEAAQVVQNVVDTRLKASGYSDGVKGDNFEISRIKDGYGKSVVAVTPYDAETGPKTTVLIPYSVFESTANTLKSGRIARGQATVTRKPSPAAGAIAQARRNAFTPTAEEQQMWREDR